jgi:hypothetical protein
LAQAPKVDVILVTELTRWGRSMLDLLHTLQDLQVPGESRWSLRPACSFDLRRAEGKLIASLMAALALASARFRETLGGADRLKKAPLVPLTYSWPNRGLITKSKPSRARELNCEA